MNKQRNEIEIVLGDVGGLPLGQLLKSITTIEDEIRRFLTIIGSKIDISGPQWGVLWSITELDSDAGAPVKNVAAMLRCDASFITSQSKLLERAGLVRRSPSPRDARIVLLSLTTLGEQKMAHVVPFRDTFKREVFQGFEEQRLRSLLYDLQQLEFRAQKAVRRLAAGL